MYPKRNHFEMAAHEAGLEPGWMVERRQILKQLKAACAATVAQNKRTVKKLKELR